MGLTRRSKVLALVFFWLNHEETHHLFAVGHHATEFGHVLVAGISTENYHLEVILEDVALLIAE